eukprot:1656466-Prymnesium_polylepis.1
MLARARLPGGRPVQGEDAVVPTARCAEGTVACSVEDAVVPTRRRRETSLVAADTAVAGREAVLPAHGCDAVLPAGGADAQLPADASPKRFARCAMRLLVV